MGVHNFPLRLPTSEPFPDDNFPPVDGCPQPPPPFQASRRAVIGIGRWVSTTSEPFQASTRAVIGIGRWVSTTSEPFQASRRAVIGISRWVSTTSNTLRLPTSEPFPDDNFPPVDGCPQLLSRSHWHQSMGVHNLPRRAVIGIGRWVSTTPSSRLRQGRSLASVDGCPQLPSRSRLRQGRSLASVDGCPQLPKTSFPVLVRPSGQSGGFWNRGRKLKRKDEGISARSWFGTAFRGR